MSSLIKRPGRRASVAGAVVLATGILIGYAGGGIANDGLPADKTAVGGSAVEDIDPNNTKEILHQRMKVSSPADLILGVTSECTILTRLVTDTSGEKATADGSVDITITIDDKPVPVQTVGFDNDNNGTVGEDEGQDDGKVTFCNRTYQRTETDNETAADGVDKEDDYIRTKAANAFNWVALNVGVDATEGGYDDVALNGNNIVDIRVFATYTRTHPVNDTRCVDADLTLTTANAPNSCSEAFVGKRTLVIEPVHAAVFEQSEPSNTTTTTAGLNLGF